MLEAELNIMEKIKELRDKTGAGISDCKKALEESGGDIEVAVEILRKKGITKAAKRDDREAREGIIKVEATSDNKIGFIMEVNAETDFVVRNEKFQTFAENAFSILKENKPKDLEAFLSLPMGENSVKENLDSLSGIIGEKMGIKRVEVIETEGSVAAYSHMGGRIGVLVELDQPGLGDLAKDIAMQVAAANPKYINPDEVPEEEKAKEKEIYKEQLAKEGKPEAMMEKILEGKIAKYFDEVCLARQEYIKDDSKKICDVLGQVKVKRFIRYSL